MKELYVMNQANTFRQCLQHMDDCGLKFLVVTDSSNKAIGTVTDGDIRRALLKNASLEDNIMSIMNTKFSFVSQEQNLDKVLLAFQQKNVEFLPVLNEKYFLKNIITRKGLHNFLLTNHEFDIMFDFSSLQEQILDHEIFSKPWGFYKTIILNDMFQAKVIHVSPGEKLSLQKHQRREEHWIVVRGTGLVQIGESNLPVSAGSTFFIPKDCKHRLSNVSENEVLIMVEVQQGDYFGEDDIERLEDEYGR